MPVNGTDLINDPWNTTFSPYTDLFSRIVGDGMLFWLFPISVIGITLYVYTRDPVVVSMYLLISGALFSSANIFIGAIHAVPLFVIISAIGLAGLFISIFVRKT